MILWPTRLALAWCGWMAFGVGLGETGRAETSRAAIAVRPVGEFILVAEAKAQSPGFGMLMICPSHAHGTPDEAERKLRLLARPGSEQPSTIWICRGSLIETVRRFAPLVERVVVNPFGYQNADKPKGDEACWAGVSHPLLNGLREIRLASGDRHLLACLDVDGEPMLFGQRQASLEEIEWQLYALIGSGYQGVVWRNWPGEAERAGRLRRLKERLRPIAGKLTQARPVAWVRATGAQPMAALEGGGDLFVVLLNPNYLMPTARKEPNEGVRLPLEEREQRGELELALPKGWTVASARTLSGKSLLVRGSGERVTILYRFRGGGEMIVCGIDKSNKGER